MTTVVSKKRNWEGDICVIKTGLLLSWVMTVSKANSEVRFPLFCDEREHVIVSLKILVSN